VKPAGWGGHQQVITINHLPAQTMKSTPFSIHSVSFDPAPNRSRMMISAEPKTVQVDPNRAWKKLLKHPALLLAALFYCLWPPSTAEANRPRGTTMTGVVLSVDHASRWIVFAQDGGPVRQFVYSEWAKFWHDEAEALPAHLKAGMKVQINLHNPLIGPDFVSHIMLLNGYRQTIHPKQR
jgi:hypothetical protein